jgi:hypothetical protein
VPSTTQVTAPAPKHYTEDFTAPLAWALFTDETSIVGFSAVADNPMMVFSEVGNQSLYGYIPAYSPSDSDISLHATVVKATKSSTVGTFCRRKGLLNYEFLVSNLGTYAIFRNEEKSFSYLTGNGKWTPDPSIPKNFTSIDVGSSCRGNQLSLLVNGRVIATVTDDTYTDGRTGPAVENYGPTELRVYVDDVRFDF